MLRVCWILTQNETLWYPITSEKFQWTVKQRYDEVCTCTIHTEMEWATLKTACIIKYYIPQFHSATFVLLLGKGRQVMHKKLLLSKFQELWKFFTYWMTTILQQIKLWSCFLTCLFMIMCFQSVPNVTQINKWINGTTMVISGGDFSRTRNLRYARITWMHSTKTKSCGSQQ